MEEILTVLAGVVCFIAYFYYCIIVPFRARLKAKYFGHVESKKYHMKDCEYGRKISSRNMKYFSSVSEAKASGYIRCYECYPPESDFGSQEGC